MSDEPIKPDIEAVLVDKCLMLAVLTRQAFGKPMLSEEESVRLVEQTMVQVKSRKNSHVRDHSEKYDRSCVFCVEAVEASNEAK